MEKFNRKMAREISQKVEEALLGMYGSGKFEYKVNGGTIYADKLRLNLEIRLKNEDGTLVVSDDSHRAADLYASMEGLKLEGHLIGSTWDVNGSVFTVIEYSPRRRKYPLLFKSSEGKLVKASASYLKRGTQLTAPTKEEFVIWFTVDPEEDAVKESDVEICDRVQAYLTDKYSAEDVDKYFDMVDKLNEKGTAKKYAERAYEFLIEDKNSMKTAYLDLKLLYKSKK